MLSGLVLTLSHIFDVLVELNKIVSFAGHNKMLQRQT
jgi:hypothetical protein